MTLVNGAAAGTLNRKRRGPGVSTRAHFDSPRGCIVSGRSVAARRAVGGRELGALLAAAHAGDEGRHVATVKQDGLGGRRDGPALAAGPRLEAMLDAIERAAPGQDGAAAHDLDL